MRRTHRRPKGRKALHFIAPGAYDTPELYQHMFQEDVQLLGHFSNRAGPERSVLRLDGTEEERAKADYLFTSIGRDHYRSEDNAAGAIENVVMNLAHYGTALYEIVRNPEDLAPALSSFDPDYTWKVGFFYLQVVPRSSFHDLDRRYAVLRSSDVWRIDMPSELDGAKGYKRILKEMSASSSLGPEFYKDDLKKQQLPQEFNFRDYRRAHQVLIYRVTKTWGWGARDWSLDFITEYYRFHRHLTFKWAEAILREHVVEEFNDLFIRLGISMRVIIEGLSSPMEILKIRDQMRSGALDFAGAAGAVH